jgi:hypothetical protein
MIPKYDGPKSEDYAEVTKGSKAFMAITLIACIVTISLMILWFCAKKRNWFRNRSSSLAHEFAPN